MVLAIRRFFAVLSTIGLLASVCAYIGSALLCLLHDLYLPLHGAVLVVSENQD
jgi:hypothetical protein